MGWGLEGSWGGCIYSPTHEVTVLKYLIYEHPPIKHIWCHSVTTHILWRVLGVGDGGVVGGFMGWMVVGWVVGGFMDWVGVWWCG